MKILLKSSFIDINTLKELKVNNKITFNPKDSNIDLVIEDTNMYFNNFKDYSVDYTHWINNTSLAFIVDILEETLLELSSINF